MLYSNSQTSLVSDTFVQRRPNVLICMFRIIAAPLEPNGIRKSVWSTHQIFMKQLCSVRLLLGDVASFGIMKHRVHVENNSRLTSDEMQHRRPLCWAKPGKSAYLVSQATSQREKSLVVLRRQRCLKKFVCENFADRWVDQCLIKILSFQNFVRIVIFWGLKFFLYGSTSIHLLPYGNLCFLVFKERWIFSWYC